jgi:hypothetical protein
MLQLILICSLFSYGMFTIQRPGFVLHGLRGFWKLLPEALHETFFACGVCVASLWGGSCFIYVTSVDTFVPVNLQPIAYLPVAMICCSGLNAVLDRAVKAFEKHYGYQPPSTAKGEQQWNYLLPYAELRKTICRQFLVDNLNRGYHVIEIGGFQDIYSNAKRYHSYGYNNKLDEHEIVKLIHHFRTTKQKYVVFIMGLYYEGNLRFLKKLIQEANVALIEYSDDGISRQQIDLITEGIKTKLLIPEYTINSHDQTSPTKCGSTEKRKIIILQP